VQRHGVRRRGGDEERVLGEEEGDEVALPLHRVVQGSVPRPRHARFQEAPRRQQQRRRPPPRKQRHLFFSPAVLGWVCSGNAAAEASCGEEEGGGRAARCADRTVISCFF
jgi:hypothetical protein